MKNHPYVAADPNRQRKDTEEVLICFCMKISKQALIAAIADGATDLTKLMHTSRAGTGCGTCRVDLLHLLAAQAGTKTDA